MKFKPTLWKSIVSILAIVIWYLFNLFTSNTFCATVGRCLLCPKAAYPSLLQNCCGCGVNLLELISQIIIILLPGIIIYIIYSLVQTNKKKRGKK